jgi:phosphoadenosine phosphosulfate reductase
VRANANQAHLWPVHRMVDEATEYLIEHEPVEGYSVGFSGGKDSIVTLELCRMAGVKHEAWYSFPGIDPPELLKFIKAHYPDVRWAFPKRSYWSLLQTYSPPFRNARWCCSLSKEAKIPDAQSSHWVLGLRAEESPARAKRPRTNFHEKRKVFQYKPIFWWTAWHVWGFIKAARLPYPSLYEEGFERIGCMICPFWLHNNQGSRDKLKLHKERWPAFFRTFEKAVKRWHDRRERKESFEQYIEAYYRGFES